jgi:hypothetical protein
MLTAGQGLSKLGSEEMFNVKRSMVNCHFRMRLRRGIFKKRLREAPPPMTIDH